MDFQLFQTTFINVMVMLLYLMVGFVLRKIKFVKEQHLPMLSMILMYACTPFMILNAFLGMDFSVSYLGNMVLFFIFALLMQLCFFLIMFAILHKKFANSRIRIISVAAVLGNVGYFGMPIIKAMFPDSPEVVCYSSMYMAAMNVMVYTVGAYALTGDKKYMSPKKVLINPATIGLYVAIPCWVLGVNRFIPSAFMNAFASIGNMSAPICMIILGVRLAAAPIKDIFTDKGAYIAAGLKLIVYPLCAFLAVKFLPVPYTFKASAVVLSSAPCAAVILSLAEVYQSERETSAHVLLLTTMACFITIPLLTVLL